MVYSVFYSRSLLTNFISFIYCSRFTANFCVGEKNEINKFDGGDTKCSLLVMHSPALSSWQIYFTQLFIGFAWKETSNPLTTSRIKAEWEGNGERFTCTITILPRYYSRWFRGNFVCIHSRATSCKVWYFSVFEGKTANSLNWIHAQFNSM